MLTLYGSMTIQFSVAFENEGINQNIELLTFKRWLAIEAVMFTVTVLSNIIVIFLRTCYKDPLLIDLDSLVNEQTESIDFLRSENTQLVVNFLSVCLFPLGVFAFSERDNFDIDKLTDDNNLFQNVSGFISSSFELLQKN